MGSSLHKKIVFFEVCGRGGEAHGGGKGLFEKILNENFIIKKNATQMGGSDGICFA